VTAHEFELSAQKHGAYLSKEDIAKVVKLFPGGPIDAGVSVDNVNYQKLSNDLGIHLNSFEFLRSHHSRQ
jgi:hypothetical protein